MQATHSRTWIRGFFLTLFSIFTAPAVALLTVNRALYGLVSRYPL